MNENSDRGSSRVMSAHLVTPTASEGRKLVGRMLEGQDELVLWGAELFVTELITNGYVHGIGYTREELAKARHDELSPAVRLTVVIERSERSQKWYATMAVHDPNPDRPDWGRDLTGNDGDSGRGLAIIRTLFRQKVVVTGYGAVSCGAGKDVLVEFEIDPPPGS